MSDNTSDLIDRLRERMRRQDLTKAQVAETIGVSAPAVHKWLQGTTTPRDYNRRRIRKFVDEEITAAADPDSCRIRGCDAEPVYEYHNPHSGARGRYCEPHMNTRRSDMDAGDWIELGFADVINS